MRERERERERELCTYPPIFFCFFLSFSLSLFFLLFPAFFSLSLCANFLPPSLSRLPRQHLTQHLPWHSNQSYTEAGAVSCELRAKHLSTPPQIITLLSQSGAAAAAAAARCSLLAASQPVYAWVGLSTDKVNHGADRTPSTALRHPSSEEERCQKAMFGVWVLVSVNQCQSTSWD